jgi:AcrR family transcriptional regulator
MADRMHQKQRTRRDLLAAARALARDGRSPTIAEVAEAAGVSTATAYRYFPSGTALWASTRVEDVSPAPSEVFAGIDAGDTGARVDALVRLIAWPQLDDESLWRNVARSALERWFEQADLPAEQRVPVRSDARLNYIDEALAGLDEQIPPATRARLRSALTLVVGIDAMLALRDSCLLPADGAKDVMLWAATALLAAAEHES